MIKAYIYNSSNSPLSLLLSLNISKMKMITSDLNLDSIMMKFYSFWMCFYIALYKHSFHKILEDLYHQPSNYQSLVNLTYDIEMVSKVWNSEYPIEHYRLQKLFCKILNDKNGFIKDIFGGYFPIGSWSRCLVA